MKSLIRTLFASVLFALPAVAQGQGLVPIGGRFSGTGSPIATVTGNASHMGRITGTAVVVTATPTGFIGTFDWRAANGDHLVGTIEVTITGPTSVPGIFTFTETALYTGGTGRFAGVTGSGTGAGLYNFLTTDFSATFQSLITSVGSSHH